MFGNGVGLLRVKIRYAGGDEQIPDSLLWEMSGESGNNWHVAQVPISSPVLSYQVLPRCIHSAHLCLYSQSAL